MIIKDDLRRIAAFRYPSVSPNEPVSNYLKTAIC